MGAKVYIGMYKPFDGFEQRASLELSSNRSYTAVGHIGNYALFAGGYGNSVVTNVIDVYDTSFTRCTPISLTSNTWYKSLGSNAINMGDNLLIAGGRIGANSTDSSNYTSGVDSFNTSLTKTGITSLSKNRDMLASANNGDYAIFAGGTQNENYTSSDGFLSTVDAYNSSLTRSTPTALSQSRRDLGGSSVGDYAIFAGGSAISYARSNVVDAYNKSLTRSIATTLSSTTERLGSARNNTYALFGGGYNGNLSKTVIAYNSSLTQNTSVPDLSQARDYLTGGKIDTLAYFCGGRTISAIDMYDGSLTKTYSTDLSNRIPYMMSTILNGHLLISNGDLPTINDILNFEHIQNEYTAVRIA